MSVPQTDIPNRLESIYRTEYRKVYSTLVRLLNDWDLAEEVTNEAFAIAMERWTAEGMPENPVAWLISVAKFKAIDAIRSNARLAKNSPEIAQQMLERLHRNSAKRSLEIEDDQLRLIFACCHPAIEPNVRIPLTLREVCGLTTEEIAAAFLVPPSTMAQRIVRGKNKIRIAKIPIEIPTREEVPHRIQSVLAVLYLVFSEGYAASQGDRHLRPDLTSEAIRLGRLVASDLPDPEAIGLLALMLLQESRSDARLNANGDIVLLEEQDRTRWKRESISEGLVWLSQVPRAAPLGFYRIQALIAAVHARATTSEATDWAEIVQLYDLLLQLRPSPIIQLNRAVAVAMRDGPLDGLKLMQSIAQDRAMRSYHLLFAAQADLHRRLGNWQQAKSAYEQALAHADQSAEQRFLKKRIAEVESQNS